MTVQTVLFSDTVTIFASSKAGPVPVVLDHVDAERLNDKPLSVGSHGYAQLWWQGQSTPVHRWILGAERGDGQLVDHVNGDRYDNRRSNLRFVTHQENAANRRCSSASGFRGVYQRGRKWHAQGKVAGRNHHLGTFATAEEAAQVAHEWRLENLPGYLGRDITTAPTVNSVAA